MTEVAVKYDVPLTEERIIKFVSGTLTEILEYSFDHSSQSVPGSNQDGSETITTFQIQTSGDSGEKRKLEFRGFVGAELVGHRVVYEEKIIETTTLFDPAGRENDSSYRRGKKEVEQIQRLCSDDRHLPMYSARQRSVFSL